MTDIRCVQGERPRVPVPGASGVVQVAVAQGNGPEIAALNRNVPSVEPHVQPQRYRTLLHATIPVAVSLGLQIPWWGMGGEGGGVPPWGMDRSDGGLGWPGATHEPHSRPAQLTRLWNPTVDAGESARPSCRLTGPARARVPARDTRLPGAGVRT